MSRYGSPHSALDPLAGLGGWKRIRTGRAREKGKGAIKRKRWDGSSGGSRISEGGGKDEAPQAPRSSRRRREDRDAEGAEGGGVWAGVSPPHWERGLGRGLCPLPRNFFLIFHLKIVSFSALWRVFYHSSAALFTAKKQCFWLPELANESTAERANGKTPVGNNICMK